MSIDFALVMQVFENLVANAARYAGERVQVSCSIGEEYLTLIVRDDGQGFSPEALRLAAQPFYREEGEQTDFHFGLGLYICSLICEKCGGRLTPANHDTGAVVTAEIKC